MEIIGMPHTIIYVFKKPQEVDDRRSALAWLANAVSTEPLELVYVHMTDGERYDDGGYSDEITKIGSPKLFAEKYLNKPFTKISAMCRFQQKNIIISIDLQDFGVVIARSEHSSVEALKAAAILGLE